MIHETGELILSQHIKTKTRSNVRAHLDLFEFEKTEKPKSSWEEHMHVHEHPIIYHQFHSSDGFAITYKKSALTVEPFLRNLNLTKPKNQKIMGRTHAAEEYPNIYHSFHYSDGFAITCKKSAQTVKPFLRYCNLKNRTIWLVDTVLNRNWRTRCDPNMQFWPEWALCKPVTWQIKSEWACYPNLRKTRKIMIFTILGTFFKIYVFGHNSWRTFLNIRFLRKWAQYKVFTWHIKPE